MAADNKLSDLEKFVVGVELVTSRHFLVPGGLLQPKKFINEISGLTDYIGLTDNAGGITSFDPDVLLTEVRDSGLIALTHFTCKDRNRAALESRAWSLHQRGIRNILALTGDAPVKSDWKTPKGVYDIDSAVLVFLLNKMNNGLVEVRGKREFPLEKTDFCTGVGVNPFKFKEEELVPQYYRLTMKAKAGADFVVPQLGYDSRKIDEFARYMKLSRTDLPFFGNVYLLSKPAARFFKSGKVPGVILSDELADIAEKQTDKTWFYEFAAKQAAVYRGLGASGIHFAGINSPTDLENILNIFKSFSEKGWLDFIKETCFGFPNQFYLFQTSENRLNTDEFNPEYTARKGRASLGYYASRLAHNLFFDNKFSKKSGKFFYEWLEKHQSLDKSIGFVERLFKTAFYGCRYCGDCTIPELSFMCPRDKCGKGIINGPCGGSSDGLCEVYPDRNCFYAEDYRRRKAVGKHLNSSRDLIITDGALDRTPSFKSHFLERSHKNSLNNSQ